MDAHALWAFALALYGRPGAAPACLALQDEAAADVTLVLYLIWCAETGRPLNAEAVRSADAAVAPWRAAVVAPLRAVRRAMKAPLLPGLATESLRDRIKASEIEAERLALVILAVGAPAPEPSAPEPLAAANRYLDLYAVHLGRPLPPVPREALLRALAEA
ncbi:MULTISPECIES: TIGR02444 family protein [Methylobacterium]|uniref:TIGR02444 family protein n=4 Tax=Methylobacterium TaxID=407 RepID=A0ABR5HHA3_9HYPH|nr:MULTISPECIES: TIGR02444 family protein [Methylobacterium]KMO19314.1 hypothetical protein QR78_12845 [Methylobacterium indicum]KMO26051.1 hypothetical protein QR79_04740 [Methylobacterium indicum]TGD99710.1 TIGR02444 family protein [Methylobacterium nonmethylotrophicum]BAQ45988.1 hypothetical protein Maq22A_c13965 [Methylobacterium aquaticum]